MPRFLFFIFLISNLSLAQITVLDSVSKFPVSYATISFGDGQGIFADDEGMFVFNTKLYPDVDSLFVSAIGFKNIAVATNQLPKQLFMTSSTDELDEVVVIGNILNRKFKIETLKPYLDDDYYNCWLPTIESEIAVYFPKTTNKDQELSSIIFPIALESKDWKKRKRSNSDKKKFSTLFKVQFYAYDHGLPGQVLTYETIVFRATEKDGDSYELNVEDYNLHVPEDGFFVSIQAMGYTDKSGKLLPNKKYKEIKSKNGVVKIPTNFRPLLPFTNQIKDKNTFIKRVFINGNNWVKFDKGNGFESSLLKRELYNYGIGLKYKTFKEN